MKGIEMKRSATSNSDPSGIKIQVLDGGTMPKRAHEEDACFDCFVKDQTLTLNQHRPARIGLGFKLDLPPGWEARIRGRSGLALKHSLIVHAGTIDCNFKDEVCAICMVTCGLFRITPGMRICQISFHRREQVELVESVIDGPSRGGFGSTGTHQFESKE